MLNTYLFGAYFLFYNKNMEEKVLVEPTEKGKKLGKAAKIIAIICFSLVLSTLFAATVSDFVIFAEQILKFAASIIATAMIFVFMVILFVVCFVLIFGFFLVESKGFWPLTITINAFKEMMGDIKFNSNQLATLVSVRWVLLVICILCLASSIVSLSLRKAAIKQGFIDKNKHIKKFDVVALVFSSLGIAVATIVLLVANLIK